MMRQRIFLYLFVFSALVALYLAVSGSRNLQERDAKTHNLEASVNALEDSLQQARLQVLDMRY